MKTPADLSSSPTLQKAINGGRVSAYEPTGNDAIDALLFCADFTDTVIDSERIAAAVRVKPDTVAQAARAVGMAVRPVDLTRDSKWWQSDAEILVVLWNEIPSAVITNRGHAQLFTPDGHTHRITSALAQQISPEAWGVIPVFADFNVSLRSAWRLGWAAGGKRDVAALILLTVSAIVLGTVVPIASGTIVGELVPSGDLSRIYFLTIILILAAFLGAFIVVGQSIISQRMSGRFSVRLTAAMYERVFRLRSGFHRKHVPGELAGRLAGVEAFATGISTATPTVLSLTGLLLASSIVLARVSIVLTVAVLAMSLMVLVIAGFAIPKFLRDAQKANEISLELGGITFAILGGIAKIRAAGAEERMLKRWLFRFSRQQAASRDQSRRGIFLGLLSTLPASLIPLILVLVEVSDLGSLDLGAFTTATAASAQAAGAIAGLIPVTLAIAALVPVMRSLQPILIAEPEQRGSAAEDPGELLGDIAFEHVSFGYENEAQVLKDVTFHVPSGTMTAIVGPSGSGKSTIIRLLLGLEEPHNGQVLFDGRTLASLDRIAVLNQMGIVPQDAVLASGSILDNILGGTHGADEADAWRAVELAGLGDDIRAMPMGIRTVISDGASTFSGGQRQRIMIARALVSDPKILVLDEATSALDNQTQEQVARSIATLGTTRIVIAHRLSTIRMADQIIVVDQGRIVEIGNYSELMHLDGMFASFASRQTL